MHPPPSGTVPPAHATTFLRPSEAYLFEDNTGIKRLSPLPSSAAHKGSRRAVVPEKIYVEQVAI